jgi:hypothetical protein
MEVALTAFLVTVAIVGGILSPFFLFYILTLIGKFLEAVTLQLQGWVEDVKKRPPFEDVQVNVNPATNVMTVRMIKDGKVVWQGASSRRQMEDNETLTFTSTEVEQ